MELSSKTRAYIDTIDVTTMVRGYPYTSIFRNMMAVGRAMNPISDMHMEMETAINAIMQLTGESIHMADTHDEEYTVNTGTAYLYTGETPSSLVGYSHGLNDVDVCDEECYARTMATIDSRIEDSPSLSVGYSQVQYNDGV